MKEKIIELRNQGLSYNKIQKELGCSKGTISYHLGPGQKEKSRDRAISNPNTILSSKIDSYKKRNVLERKTHKFKKASPDELIDGHIVNNIKDAYRLKDVKSKFSNATCYLTGLPIDLTNGASYHLDHIIPTSKGGDNSLNNMGLAVSKANMMKGDMSVEELVEMCELILKYNTVKQID